jgi:16S rRNA (guanine527-N7)-methyltransferase
MAVFSVPPERSETKRSLRCQQSKNALGGIIIAMEKLVRDAQELFHVQVTGRQVMSLITYEKELLEWNQKFNLTAIRDVDSIRTKHFLDSFSCVLAWKANPPNRLIDVGTGAGFPGLPLKILYPNMELTLVESVGKKAMFCQHIVSVLGLEDVEVIHARAEDLGQDQNLREEYDWAVARAVAKLNVLSEYLIPLVKIGGRMLAQKGESGPAEAQSAEEAMKLLGGKMGQLVLVNLPGVAEDRYLVVVEKVAATPPQYPRKPGIPTKQPL